MAPALRKKALLILLSLAALACVGGLAPALWLRVRTKWYVHELDAPSLGRVQRAFDALVNDTSPQVSFLLCDEVDKRPPKAIHFLIVRILHERCGATDVPGLWENWGLLSGEELRSMVVESRRKRETAPQKN